MQVAPPQITGGGDFVYRLKQPDHALGQLPGVTAASITNICSSRLELVLHCDVLIIQLLGDPDMLPVILERRERGLPTVFEISDNFMNFQPHNPAARFYNVPENRACLLQLIGESDSVQVTVPPLADKFSRYNSRVRVFPNRMASTGEIEKNNDRLIVGWGGSFGHYKDIKEAVPYIIDWLKGRPDAAFALMGDAKFAALFSEIPEDRFIYRPPGDLDAYYDFVQTLDIGLVIARDDEFNLCRSDVKFMEYASRAAVPVCSRIPTYTRTVREGETGLLFGDYSEMTAHLDRLADEPEYRKRIAENAYSYIVNERMESEGAGERLAFYTELLDEAGGRGTLNPEKLAACPSLVKAADSSHFMHEFSTAETLLHNGMISQFAHSDMEKAASFYKKSLELIPDYFLANLYYAGLLSATDTRAALAHIQEARRLWLSSCEAEMSLSMVYANAGDTGKALDSMQALRERLGKYAPAHMALANYYYNTGDTDAATALYEAALDANPHFEPAMVKLGEICIRRQQYEAAEKHYLGAMEIMPDDPSARAGLATVRTRTGRYAEAADLFISAIKEARDASAVAADVLLAGKKLYAGKEYRKAAELLRTAESKIHGNAEIAFWLMRTLEKTGDKKGAAEARRKLRLYDAGDRFSRYTRNSN